MFLETEVTSQWLKLDAPSLYYTESQEKVRDGLPVLWLKETNK